MLANHWTSQNQLPIRTYQCGFCYSKTVSERGYSNAMGHATIMICACGWPTLFAEEKQVPGALPGRDVEHLPDSVRALFQEGRLAFSVGAFTAMTLALRTLISHVAEEKGGKPKQPFNAALDHLVEKGFLTPELKGWVDKIREKGNAATHDLEIVTQADAKRLLNFAEVLLQLVYEFPAQASL